MFEDFSFLSPSSRRTHRLADEDDAATIDPDSTLISPLSSRCPSPGPSHRLSRTLTRPRSFYSRSSQAPTSVPLSHDERFSIGILTKKLHDHTLRSVAVSEHQGELLPSMLLGHGFPEYTVTPSDASLCESTNGYSDPSPPSSRPVSPPSLSPYLTSASPHSVAVNRAERSDGDGDTTSIRMQRQHIVLRVQCNPTGLDIVRRELLLSEAGTESNLFDQDDCHPSSLPPYVPLRQRVATGSRSQFGRSDSESPPRLRKKSTSGHLISYRIDKSRHLSQRDLRKKSEQGLRRKSLVSAALASVPERSFPA